MRLDRLLLTLPLTLALSLAACGDDEPEDTGGEDNPEEVITTVTVTLTPSGGGTAVVASAEDSDGNGTIDSIDALTLSSGTTYVMTVGLLNELESPPEDIGAEVADEDDEHQLFFLGTGVESEATGTVTNPIVTVSYGDQDGNGDPVGLVDTTVVANTAGTGTFRVVLRHLPGVKASGLAADVASGGIDSIPGENDVDVEFDLTVN